MLTLKDSESFLRKKAVVYIAEMNGEFWKVTEYEMGLVEIYKLMMSFQGPLIISDYGQFVLKQVGIKPRKKRDLNSVKKLITKCVAYSETHPTL
jgi:hypothetical protein